MGAASFGSGGEQPARAIVAMHESVWMLRLFTKWSFGFSEFKPQRGCLFIAQRSAPFHPLFFSGARPDRPTFPDRNRAPLKNKSVIS